MLAQDPQIFALVLIDHWRKFKFLHLSFCTGAAPLTVVCADFNNVIDPKPL
jgi:hypothetical protein